MIESRSFTPYSQPFVASMGRGRKTQGFANQDTRFKCLTVTRTVENSTFENASYKWLALQLTVASTTRPEIPGHVSVSEINSATMLQVERKQQCKGWINALGEIASQQDRILHDLANREDTLDCGHHDIGSSIASLDRLVGKEIGVRFITGAAHVGRRNHLLS